MGKIVRVSAGRRATIGGKDRGKDRQARKKGQASHEERTGKPGRKDRRKDRQAKEERTGKPRPPQRGRLCG
jgi:hypothetical protein